MLGTAIKTRTQHQQHAPQAAGKQVCASLAQLVQQWAHGRDGLAQVAVRVQAQRGHLDQYGLQAACDHAIQQRRLWLVPQVRQRHQAQPAARLHTTWRIMECKRAAAAV